MGPKLRVEYDQERTRLTVILVYGGGDIVGWSFPVDQLIDEGAKEKDLSHVLD